MWWILNGRETFAFMEQTTLEHLVSDLDASVTCLGLEPDVLFFLFHSSGVKKKHFSINMFISLACSLGS